MDNQKVDRLVAEKVMGWHRRLKTEIYGYTRDPENPEDNWLEGFDNQWWTADNKEAAYVEDEGGCREDYERGWAPSSNISDAWAVVEKMGLSVLKVSEGWQARRWVTERDDSSTTADTAPLAISLCALKALGVEVEP